MRDAVFSRRTMLRAGGALAIGTAFALNGRAKVRGIAAMSSETIHTRQGLLLSSTWYLLAWDLPADSMVL